MTRLLTKILWVLAVLTALSWSPTIMMIGLLLLIVPGFILLFANTALYYFGTSVLACSLARLAGLKSSLAITIVILATVAIVAALPALIGRRLFTEFVARQTAQDFAKPAAIEPRSFELPLRWGGWGRANQPNEQGHHEARPFCGKLCQGLLYGNLADAVYVTISEDVERASDGRWEHPKRTWQFRMKKNDTGGACPEVLGGINHMFRDRRAEGTCLIGEQVDRSDADVVFDEYTHDEDYAKYNLGNPETQGFTLRRLSLWTLKSPLETVEVSERTASGLQPAEKRTEIKARVAPLPFYAWLPGGMDGRVCVATKEVEVNQIDSAEILQRRYGIELTIESPAVARRQKR